MARAEEKPSSSEETKESQLFVLFSELKDKLSTNSSQEEIEKSFASFANFCVSNYLYFNFQSEDPNAELLSEIVLKAKVEDIISIWKKLQNGERVDVPSHLEPLFAKQEIKIEPLREEQVQEQEEEVREDEAREDTEPEIGSKEWMSNFGIKLLGLRTSLASQDYFRFTKQDVEKIKLDFVMLEEEYYQVLTTESSAHVDFSRFQPLLTNIRENLDLYMNLYYVYDLLETLGMYEQQHNESSFNKEFAIKNLEKLILDARNSLNQLTANQTILAEEKIGRAEEFKSKLHEMLQIEKDAEFVNWKAPIETDYSKKIDEFRDAASQDPLQIDDLEAIVERIEAYKAELEAKETKNETRKTDFIKQKLEAINNVLQEINKKISSLSEAEEFKKTEKEVNDYNAKVKELHTLIKGIISGERLENVHFLDVLKTVVDELVQKHKAAEVAGLHERRQGASDREESIRARIFGGDSNGGDYAKALEVLDQKKEEINARASEFKKRLDILQENYMAVVNSANDNAVTRAGKEMESIIECQPDSFKKFFKLYTRMRDGYYQNTTKNTPRTLMYTKSSSETRMGIKPYINTVELATIRKMETVVFRDESGKDHSINVSHVINELEGYFKEIRWYAPGKWNKPENERGSTYTYARNGEPTWYAKYENNKFYDAEGKEIIEAKWYKMADGTPAFKLSDRLVQKFPELIQVAEFSQEFMHMFIVLSEMRKNFLIEDFASYQVSPIPSVQDFGDLPVIAPYAQHGYNVQANAYIDTSLAPYLMTFPQSPTKGINGENWIPITVQFPRSAVGADVEMAKSITVYVPPHLKSQENIELAIQLTELMRTYVSPLEIGKLQLRSHLKILPSYYDVVNGNFDNDVVNGQIVEKKLMYQPTMEEYNDLIKNIDDFFSFVTDEFKPLRNIEELDTHVGKLVDYIKKFKGIFGIIDAKTDELFTPYVQLLMILFLKKMYNSYKSLSETEKRKRTFSAATIKHIEESTTPDLLRFVEICKNLLESSKTLPAHLLTKENGHPDRDFYIVDKIFNEILIGPKFPGSEILFGNKPQIKRGLMNTLIRNVFVEPLKKKTYWGVFFDNHFKTGTLEGLLLHLKNHSLFKQFEIYARKRELSAEENKP